METRVVQNCVKIKLTSDGHVGIERSQLGVSGVGHVEVPEELDRPDARRRSDAHDGVEDDLAAQVVTQVGQETVAVDVRLEVGVLVELASTQTTNL